MAIEGYLKTLQKNDKVAVAKGRCDCGIPYAHPKMEVQVIREVEGPFIYTYENGTFSMTSGYELIYAGDDNEYHGIWDPAVSTDAEYILLDYRVMELKNYYGIDGFLDTNENILEDIEECNARLDEISAEIYEQNLMRMLEGGAE